MTFKPVVHFKSISTHSFDWRIISDWLCCQKGLKSSAIAIKFMRFKTSLKFHEHEMAKFCLCNNIQRVRVCVCVRYDLFIYSLNQSSKEMLSKWTEDVRSFFFSFQNWNWDCETKTKSLYWFKLNPKSRNNFSRVFGGKKIMNDFLILFWANQSNRNFW